jgi:hypothetical protein
MVLIVPAVQDFLVPFRGRGTQPVALQLDPIAPHVAPPRPAVVVQVLPARAELEVQPRVLVRLRRVYRRDRGVREAQVAGDLHSAYKP